MPVFEVSVGGKTFEIDAPDQASALNAMRGVGKAPPKSIDEGDWQGLSDRLTQAETGARDMGPMNPETVAAVRQEAARKEGRLYGSQNAAKSGGGLLGEGVGRAADKFALGLPRLAEAYMPSMLGGQSAIPGAEAHEFLKAADEGRAQVNPGTALTGNIGGALGQAILTPMSAATIPARIAQASAASGLIGAGEAAVESRGDLGEIGKGAGLGALIGGAGGALAEGAIAGGRAIVDPLRGLAKTGPADQQAIARIALEAKNAKLSPQAVQGELQRLGPDAMLGDALGLQGATMARSAANLSPEARSVLETTSGARLASQPARLINDIGQASGNPSLKTTSQIAELLDKVSRPKINEAYDAARAAGYDLPKTPFDELLASPKVAAAVKQATDEIRDRVAAYGGDQGSQLAIYDAAKKILDKLGFPGGGQQGDDIAKALARKLRETVDQQVPNYAGARDMAAKIKRSGEGLEVGERAAGRNPGLDVADEISRAVGKGVPEGRIAQGYGAQRIEQIANKGPSEVNLKLSPAEEIAARAALGDEKFGQIAKALDRERAFMRFHKELTGGPSTARQLAQQMAGAGLSTGAGTGAGYLAGFDLPTSASMGAALAAGKSGAKAIGTAMKAKTERQVAEELAKLLTQRVMYSPTRSMTTRRALVEELARTGSRAGALSQSNN